MTKSRAWRHYRLYMLLKDKVTEPERAVMQEHLKYVISEYCNKNDLDYRDVVSEFNNRYETDKQK